MSKKITMKMLKEIKNKKEIEVSSLNANELVEALIESFEKCVKFTDDELYEFIKPIDVEDDATQGFMIGWSGAIIALIRGACTPAAWKYISNEILREIKKIETDNTIEDEAT